ncbi:MAG: carboxynorspermidine decarboxylase [Planctomycetota bacterium]|jgi:carboxynorspermidine decarboxylase
MDKQLAQQIDLSQLQTPSFVVFEEAIAHNLSILKQVMDRTGCKILMATKCFSMVRCFPMIAEVLDGICASGPYEARLGAEYFGKEVHAFAAGFSEEDIRELAPICNHVVFNSFSQWQRFGALAAKLNSNLKFGLRCNPEHSEGEVEIYDPCAVGSRLGIVQAAFETEKGSDPLFLEGISGLHFHTLCEMDSDALERTLAAFEEKFGEYLGQMEWVNFGGGHHITRADYDVERLVRVVGDFKSRYPHLTVYLEPGEAVALNAGVLVTSVLDVTQNGDVQNTILDTSATCHMPDVLEMPYRPNVIGAGQPGEKTHTYRLGGLSCLAGDVIGDYSFDEPLEVGDRLVFLDMAIYSMVKTNTFNGVKLPWIYFGTADGQLERVRQFGYDDFKGRL